MKKIVVASVLALFVVQGAIAGNTAVSDTVKKDKNMAVTWDPLSLIALTLSGSYGVGLTDKIALIVPLGITYVGTSIKYDNSKSSSYLLGIHTGLGARFYFSGGAFKDGFYIQPNFSFGWLKFGDSGVNAISVGGNALLGYSWVWDSGFIMNLAGGVGYSHSSVDTDASAGALKIEGVLPALEFAIGYAW